MLTQEQIAEIEAIKSEILEKVKDIESIANHRVSLIEVYRKVIDATSDSDLSQMKIKSIDHLGARVLFDIGV